MGNKTSRENSPDLTSHASSTSTGSGATSMPAAILEHPDEDVKRFGEELLCKIFTFAADDVKAVVNFTHVNARWKEILQKQQQQPGETPSESMKTIDLMWRNMVHNSRPATVQRCQSTIFRHTEKSQQKTTESTDPYHNSIRNRNLPPLTSTSDENHKSSFSRSGKNSSTNNDDDIVYGDKYDSKANSVTTAGDSITSESLQAAGEIEADATEIVKSGKKIGEDFIKLARHPQALWIIEKLIYKGRIDVNYKSLSEGDTALIEAVQAGNVQVVPTLVTVGARINKRGGHGATALLHACKRGDITLARFLIDHGADPMVSDALGTSCLSAALLSDFSAELLEILLGTKKFDVNATPLLKGKVGGRGPPLLEACHVGASVKTLKMLLKAGATVDVQDKLTGMSALLLAVKNGRTDLATELVKAGANVNLTSNTGITPLMSAAVIGDVESAKLLLGVKNVRINIRDRDGETAIYLAKKHDNNEIVKMLRERGAQE